MHVNPGPDIFGSAPYPCAQETIGTDNYISPGFSNIQSRYTILAVLLTVYSRLTDIPQPVGFSI